MFLVKILAKQIFENMRLPKPTDIVWLWYFLLQKIPIFKENLPQIAVRKLIFGKKP